MINLNKPHQNIDNDYLWRWFLIPKNRIFNIYLHKFNKSDDDRAFHDHPWYSLSFLLKGESVEHSFKGIKHVRRWAPLFRTAKFAHRIEIVQGPVWTLFITGPNVRSWGFYCPKGWRHWRKFGAKSEDSSVTRGCD